MVTTTANIDPLKTKSETEKPVILPPAGSSIADPAPNQAVPTEKIPTVIFNTDHMEFAEFEEDYLRHYIEFADTKAAVVFGISSGLLLYLIEKESILALIISLPWGLSKIACAVCTALLVLSAAAAFWVVFPRLTKPQKGLIFWKDVALNKTAETYAEEISNANFEAITASRIKHCYQLARLCNRKYNWLTGSMIVGILGVCIALVLIGFSA